MQWNILAQRLCDGFDKVHDDAPILKFRNRLRLMKIHFKNVDSDIVALVEVDALSSERC